MEFTSVAHFSGTGVARLDVTTRFPWLYMIWVPRCRVLYVGETFDEGGLIGRLGSHFGPFLGSTLRRNSAAIAGVGRLTPPFVIIAAKLPFLDEGSRFDASSKQVRMAFEATVHELMGARFLPQSPGWAIVSTAQPPKITQTPELRATCESIYGCFDSTVRFLRGVVDTAPFHVVLLASTPTTPTEELDVGQAMERIEVLAHDWVMARLRAEYGDDWWTLGIPQTVRVQCVTRQEQEGTSEKAPPAAYLTFIDLRDIVQKNWTICQAAMEKVGTAQGKDKATAWLTEVNEMRKLWAHPLKQRYFPMDATKRARLLAILESVQKHLGSTNPT